MKKYLIIAAFALAMVSCKDHGLNNSFIYFSEAQPTNVDEITAFPKKFVRTYTMDYSHRLVVEPKCAYIKEIETITALKSELDSQFQLLDTIDVPFVIKETTRKYQHTISQMTIWKKKA